MFTKLLSLHLTSHPTKETKNTPSIPYPNFEFNHIFMSFGYLYTHYILYYVIIMKIKNKNN